MLVELLSLFFSSKFAFILNKGPLPKVDLKLNTRAGATKPANQYLLNALVILIVFKCSAGIFFKVLLSTYLLYAFNNNL